MDPPSFLLWPFLSLPHLGACLLANSLMFFDGEEAVLDLHALPRGCLCLDCVLCGRMALSYPSKKLLWVPYKSASPPLCSTGSHLSLFIDPSQGFHTHELRLSWTACSRLATGRETSWALKSSADLSVLFHICCL